MTNSVKKITYRKKMSHRDYLCLAYFFETGERNPDLSGLDPAALSEVKQYGLRLTKEEKAKMDEFFGQYVFGQSFASLKEATPKIKQSIQPQPVIIQQVIEPQQTSTSAPAQNQTQTADNTPLDPSLTPPTTTKKQYPVYTADQRWELAEEMEREGVDWSGRLPEEELDLSPYYFIKDPNKPVNDLTNFEPMLALKMIFDGKVTPSEVAVAIGDTGSWIFSKSMREMPNINPALKDKYIDFTPACMDMVDLRQQYLSMMNATCDDNEQMRKYSLVMGRELMPIKEKEIDDLKNQFFDKIDSVQDDTIVLASDDKDLEEQDVLKLKYDNAYDLKCDFLILARKFNFDFNSKQQLNIFGKKYTYKKLIDEFYKKYPHAISGKFYKSLKEAFLDGQYKISELIGVDFQWRVEQ